MTRALGGAGLVLSIFLFACGPGPMPNPTLWRLSVAKAGDGAGKITSDFTIDCGSLCFAAVQTGARVTLNATPEPDSTFEGWVDGCSGTGACSVTMDRDIQVNALFTAAFSPVTVTLAGDGEGRVVSDPPGIDCGSTCTASFRHGSPVTLVPSSSVDSYFEGWSGGGCKSGVCVVSPEDVPTVQAIFKPL